MVNKLQTICLYFLGHRSPHPPGPGHPPIGLPPPPPAHRHQHPPPPHGYQGYFIPPPTYPHRHEYYYDSGPGCSSVLRGWYVPFDFSYSLFFSPPSILHFHSKSFVLYEYVLFTFPKYPKTAFSTIGC